MGMNPLTIALQQGTQLSAILNTMKNPLQGIAIAFRSIINPVSLLSIAIVALIAAGVQLTDWTRLTKGLLEGLADTLEMTAPYALGLAAALALIYAPSILSGLAALTARILSIGTAAVTTSVRVIAAFAAANPVGFFTLIAVGAAFAVNEVGKLFGVDLLENVRKPINMIIGMFVGAYKAIEASWSMLPSVIGNIVVNVANTVLNIIPNMINTVIAGINGLIDAVPDWAGGDNLGRIEFSAPKNLIANPFAEEAKKALKVMDEEMYKALNEDYITSFSNSAREAAASAAASIRDFAAGIGKEDKKKKKTGKTPAEMYDDIVRGAERRITSLEAEQKALYMTETAAAKLKYETDLLNQAQQKNIDLSPQQRDQLGKLAESMALIEAETEKTRKAMEFLKDTGKGFITDMRSSLAEGASLWESFGNAVTNIINKIADKLLDSGINMVFEGFRESSGSSGILSSIAGFFGFAKGGSFDKNNVNKFAKGGAFTNSVVSKPTLFQFANGSAFGEMGEAGPEAVMPLHRSSDGSLGVKASGNTANDNRVTIILNNNNNSDVRVNQTETSNGLELDITIDELVGEKIGETGSFSNRALKARDNRTLKQR